MEKESNEDLTFSSIHLKNPTSLRTYHADTDNFKLFTHLTGDGTCNKPWTINKIPFCCATRFFHYRRFCRYVRETGHLPHHRLRRKQSRNHVDVPHIHTAQTMQIGGWIGWPVKMAINLVFFILLFFAKIKVYSTSWWWLFFAVLWCTCFGRSKVWNIWTWQKHFSPIVNKSTRTEPMKLVNSYSSWMGNAKY